MIITIDGPAGAGKSSASRKLARRLGFRFLDTGAMYRAVALAAIENNVDPRNDVQLVSLAEKIEIELDAGSVRVNGRDVTADIRRPEVSQLSSIVAESPGVRAAMVRRQRDMASQGDFVCEGRDQGTVAFPQAECKFYLTATADERARRRRDQLLNSGTEMPMDQVLAQQRQRDARDKTRPVGRLQMAQDAQMVSTDGLTLEQVVDRLENIARSVLGLDKSGPSTVQ